MEYSLRFAHLTDKEPRCSRIAFRSKEERLQQVELVFEAIGSGLRYQETLCIHDVNNSPIILTLSNIPTLDVLILEDGFAFTVEQYQLKYCTIKLMTGESISIDKFAKIFANAKTGVSMIHGNGVGVPSGTVMQLNVPEGVLLNIGNGAFVCR